MFNPYQTNDIHWATWGDEDPADYDIDATDDVMRYVTSHHIHESEDDLTALRSLMDKVSEFTHDDREAAKAGIDFIHNDFGRADVTDDWS